MNVKVFLDTNLWVYAYSSDPKGEVVRALIASRFRNIALSTQVLGEFFTVLSRKLKRNRDEAAVAVRTLSDHFPVQPVSRTTVEQALDVCSRTGYSFWDSQIIASAVECGCGILYSEDLQPGPVAGTRLRIINPLTP